MDLSFFQVLQSLYFDHTFRVVMGGCIIIGFTCGAIGTFAYIKKQGMIGDVVSHATLPGVALAFLIFKNRNFITIGAILSALIGVYLVQFFISQTKTKEDSALGLMLSVFFGVGMVFLSIVNQLPYGQKAGLNRFLFGMASTITTTDIYRMIFLSMGCFLCVFLFWRKLIISNFDFNYAKTIGVQVEKLNTILMLVLTVAIVSVLEIVGIILTTALIIAPAVAARQWTHRIGKMFFLAGFIGGFASALGALVSSLHAIPTGPIIALVVTLLAFFSIGFSPKRGIIFNIFRKAKQMKTMYLKKTLLALKMLAKNHPSFKKHPHHIKVIGLMNCSNKKTIKKNLKKLKQLNLVEEVKKDYWVLTKKGSEKTNFLEKINSK